jgi:transposase
VVIIEPSSFKQIIITRIKRAKLFVFLRHHRHELFNDVFQEELATLYAASLRG